MSEYPSIPTEPQFTLKGGLQLEAAAEALEVQSPKRYRRLINNFRIYPSVDTQIKIPESEGVDPQTVNIGYGIDTEVQLDIIRGIERQLADPHLPTQKRIAAEALKETISNIDQMHKIIDS